MDEVKLIQAIYCTKKRAGDGNSCKSPVRIVTEIFDVDGKLLAKNDPYGGYTIEQLYSFANYVKNTNDNKEGCVDRWKSQ